MTWGPDGRICIGLTAIIEEVVGSCGSSLLVGIWLVQAEYTIP